MQNRLNETHPYHWGKTLVSKLSRLAILYRKNNENTITSAVKTQTKYRREFNIRATNPH